jgi:hypothetical protein
MHPFQQDNLDFALGKRRGGHELRFSREPAVEVTRID